MASIQEIPEWLPIHKMSLIRCGKCMRQGHLGHFGYDDNGNKRPIICPSCNGHGVSFSIKQFPEQFKVKENE